ncbi:hypothetical protein [Salinibacterium sp. ZJ77]|uniref:hypothetical protein n=1 Tax=Salinibacterium sp. ZJ77 TaxID=2708337 RepID=UPI00141FEB1D|nr:hypothetical protein [Salinibacterium sp. ZJ77]
MTKRQRRGTAVSALAVLVIAMTVPGAVAAAEDDEAPPSSTIAIPYQGEVELPAADGWTLLCDPPVELPEGVLVECTSEAITFSAPEYDADWGVHEISVRQTASGRTLDAGYRVQLAPPAPPVIVPTVWRSPADAGSTLLVPLSDLGVTCIACAAATVEVLGVEPASRAHVGTNGTHLVIRPNRDAEGMLVITFGVVDQFGQSTPVQLGVAVRPALTSPAGGLHVAMESPTDSPLELSALDLVWSADAVELDGARVIACGPALSGSVACDGTAVRYLPPAPDPQASADAPAVVDQFSVRVVTRPGRELDASVTVRLVAPEAELAARTLVAAPLTASAPLGVSPIVPAEEGGSGSSGILAPLSRILDGHRAALPFGGSP